MNSLYNLALRQSASIHTDLASIESNAHDAASLTSLYGQMTASMAAFTRTVDDYENMAKRELNTQKREKALQRVKKFREEEREMRGGFAQVKGGRIGGGGSGGGVTSSSTASASAMASSLPTAMGSSPGGSLYARTASHGVTAPTNGHMAHQGALPPQDRPDPLSAYRMNASAAAMFGGGNDYGMSAREGHALREHSFIQQTEAQLDSFIAQGREVWTNLTEQRDILKGTQRRLRDVGVTLGLSRDVIGYIERRSTQDNVLFVVGALFTLVSFYYIYKWFG